MPLVNTFDRAKGTGTTNRGRYSNPEVDQISAEALRTKRRQQAEERAQKTAVKLLLPLILFIFPAILIVLGGPAGIKLAQTLGGGGTGNLKTG